MRTYIKICTICLLCLIGFVSNSVAQIATIPFVHDGLMYIKVKVNDHSEPLNFVFDTGASTVVLDEKIAKTIGVKANYEQPAEGASGTEMYHIALSQKIHIQNVTINDAHIVLVDLERLSKKGNLKIDGIIGANIMKQFVTKIDYDVQEIGLYNSVDEITERSGYKELDVILDYSQIPQIPLEFTLENKQKFKGNFLFDSGAHMTFLLNTPFVKENKMEALVEKVIENEAEGLTTSSNFKTAKIASVKLGDLVFGEMPMNLSNSEAGVMASKQYTGILGIKIINRFHIILDYKNQKIYLKPNSAFQDAFEFPVSGISLEKEAENIKVSNVITAAEAYKKGVREGDLLLEIDDVAVKDIKECRQLLKQEDEKIKLKLQNENGEIKTVIILLKRLI